MWGTYEAIWISHAQRYLQASKVEENGTDQKVFFCVVDEILGHKRELTLHPHIPLKDTLDKFSKPKVQTSN